MRLLEHSGKDIMKQDGFSIPKSVLVSTVDDLNIAKNVLGFPMVMKVQVLSGGRGKLGGVIVANTEQEAIQWLKEMLYSSFSGQLVTSILCEEVIPFYNEYYVSFSLDATRREILLLFSISGGVDVEEQTDGENLHRLTISIEQDLNDEKLNGFLLSSNLPDNRASKLTAVIKKLYKVFRTYDCTLLEINPIVWTTSNNLGILDVHFYVDDNAVPFHEVTKEIVSSNRELYRQTWFKLHYGFDFVELNREGTVALLSTGAGLSMAIVDEMKERQIEPINFADVRSGQIKGDPARLVVILEEFKKFRNLEYIFVSIFAGITDLAEFAVVLLKAKEQVHFNKDVKWILRLEGNNYAKAKRIIEEQGIFVTNSLEQSLRVLLGGESKFECTNP
ncbi:ATP-grasp domain-containing protein [Oceanobacillus saliphilus]|uniref:ATP-grasp domain-containing protein n=1 Tax=Oceanobacillus saliphilus TaxID=2925834 RepID=UPI00201DF571|nr:ATP-grasp domain-containing protein [Oceanobacillus saliphilus]